MKIKFSIFVAIAAVFVILGSASVSVAQTDPPRVGYEDPFELAATFAVNEGGKLEKATVTLVSIVKADLETSAEGITHNLCLEIKVKKGSKKAVKRYATTVVYRDMDLVYSLKSWVISKKPPKC